MREPIRPGSVQLKEPAQFVEPWMDAHDSFDEPSASVTPFLDKPFSTFASHELMRRRAARARTGAERRASVRGRALGGYDDGEVLEE